MQENLNDLQRKQHLFYEQVDKMDVDQAYQFQLRGDHPNLMIDIALPLLSLSQHLRKLDSCPEIENLYSQVCDEIRLIERELQSAEIDHAQIIAYRYILCTVLDEAVLQTAWGQESIWGEHSLLIRFHQENWGGEKVFQIITRLLADVVQYRFLLEFTSFCLALGFHGKYYLVDGGEKARYQLIQQLNEALALFSEPSHPMLTEPTKQVVSSHYRLEQQLPLWGIVVGFVGGLTVIFLIYRMLLNQKSMSVLEQLQQLL